MSLTTWNRDQPAGAGGAAAWSAEWTMEQEAAQQPSDLVVELLFEDYLRLKGLEEALATLREDLPAIDDD